MPPPNTLVDCHGKFVPGTQQNTVIARRAQPDVAISWHCVRIRTRFQEIATPSARNDMVVGGWIPCFIYHIIEPGRRGHATRPTKVFVQ